MEFRNFDDRQKSAAFNYFYHKLNDEFNVRRMYGEQNLQMQMNKILLQKSISLSYMNISIENYNGNEFDMKWYTSGGEKNNRPSDLMFDTLCEHATETFIIEEFFPVTNLQMKRFLPLITAYLLQEGIQNINTEGKAYQNTVRFAAFWVFESCLSEENKGNLLGSLFEAVNSEREKNSAHRNKENEPENRCFLAQNVLHTYRSMLTTYFPRFTEGKKEIIASEIKKICEDIIPLKVERILTAQDYTKGGRVNEK